MPGNLHLEHMLQAILILEQPWKKTLDPFFLTGIWGPYYRIYTITETIQDKDQKQAETLEPGFLGSISPASLLSGAQR